MAALRFGPWVVQRVLGRGGMGELYAARHAESGLEAAVKVMRAELVDPEAVLRFDREVRTLAAVRHPGVVAPLDAGRSLDGRPWLAMEHVRGESLQALVQRAGPLPARDAARLVERVARALDQVHAQGIVHRDIKPENILLGEDGQPRVIDFGLARFLLREGSLTASSELLGTPAYMAPEQADGRARQAGPPADVYALGGTLFFLLTGRAPFVGPSAISVFQQVLLTPAPTPTSLVPGLPAEVEAVVMRCLEKDPAARYPTAGAVADALAAAQGAGQLPVRPWAHRRRRRRTALAGVIGAAALGGAGLAVALTRGGPPPVVTAATELPPPAAGQATESPPGVTEPPAPRDPPPHATRSDADADLLEALRAARARLERDAADVDAWVEVARLARRTERPGRSWLAPALRRVARRAPRRGDVRLELAWTELHEGRSAEALAAADEAVSLERAVAAEAHTVAALALGQRGDEPGARRRLRLALEADPEAVLASCLTAVTGHDDPVRGRRALDACVARAPRAPEPLVTRAHLLLASGDVAAALDDLDQAVRLERYGIEPLRARCQALRSVGRHEEALADAQALLRRDPWSPGGFLLRANARLAGGDLVAAIADCEREVASPRAGSTAEAIEQARRLASETAERLTGRLLERARGADELRALSQRLEREGATRAALRAVLAAVEAAPPGTVEDGARQVDLLLATYPTPLDAAERAARATVERWPTSAVALSAQADVLRGLGQHEESMRVAEAALAIDPDSARAARVRGLAEFGRQHRITGPWLERAAELDPKGYEVRAVVALALGRTGEQEAALAQLAAIEAEAPCVGWAPHFVAQVLMLRRPIDWAKVAEAETRALELQPWYGDAWWYRGVGRHLLGDLDGAVADLNQSFSLSEHGSGDGWLLRARMRLAQGDLDGALEDAREAQRRRVRDEAELAALLDGAAGRAGLDPDLVEGFTALRRAVGRR